MSDRRTMEKKVLQATPISKLGNFHYYVRIKECTHLWVNTLFDQMARCGTVVSSPRCKRTLFARFIGLSLCATCLFVGATLALLREHDRILRDALTNTTCLLLNYSVFKTQCGASSARGHGALVRCTYETLQFQYSIANHKQIIGDLRLKDSALQLHQTEVGADSLHRQHTWSFCLLIRLGWPQLHVLLRYERSHLCSFKSARRWILTMEVEFILRSHWITLCFKCDPFFPFYLRSYERARHIWEGLTPIHLTSSIQEDLWREPINCRRWSNGRNWNATHGICIVSVITRNTHHPYLSLFSQLFLRFITLFSSQKILIKMLCKDIFSLFER